MKKITRSSAIIIDRALDLYKEGFKEEIREAIENGHNPLFTERYVDEMIRVVKEEIESKSVKPTKWELERKANEE